MFTVFPTSFNGKPSTGVRLKYKHKEGGHVLAEFTAAIVLFFFSIFLPFANFSAIPLRYLTAYSCVSGLTHDLCRYETRSEAVAMALSDNNYQRLADELGVSMENCQISMVCKDQNGDSITLPNNSPVPTAWLPGGSQGQCDYFLQTAVVINIAPWVCLKPAVPGVSSPLSVTFTTTDSWENLGCDPSTQKFYLNE